MHFPLAVGKARKPKFELHLHIHDLNNVPLVSGNSYIKWHLTHSIHAEHRGRTAKCPIANHRVDYGFRKLVPSIRISIDKNNHLSECPIEFEILQEFALAEKITLGHVRLNLSEYVEESETHAKDVVSPRKRSNSVNVSPTSKPPVAGAAAAAAAAAPADDEHVEEGIVRRYLMQDSKINSTLRVSILMVQVDGERSYVAPTLRTAPVFGGIAGLMAPEQVEDEIGPTPSVSKSRDQSEVQDLYRRTLAASWQRQPSELPADECIEDIFSGGNGWRTAADGTSSDVDDANWGHYDTVRPNDFRRMSHQHHRRHSSQTDTHHHHHLHHHNHNHNHSHHHHYQHHRSNSASSDKSSTTVVGHSVATTASSIASSTQKHRLPRHSRNTSRTSLRAGSGVDDIDEDDDLGRSPSGSITSMTPTLHSDRAREHGGLKHVREVHEGEIRDDLVAWRLPGGGELAAV